MADKIGVGIVTCNRPDFLNNLLNSLVQCKGNIDELVVVNDGDTLPDLDIPLPHTFLHNEDNMGVGKSKNRALRFLMRQKCDFLFLIEDDVEILDSQVFSKYINAYKYSNIHHFNFAFHGVDNYVDGVPAIRLSIQYSPDVTVNLFPNVYGAFSFYTKQCIETAGYMDERYYNAMEHVDHTQEIIKKDMHPPFRWFADIADSNKYIREMDYEHKRSEIRKDQSWVDNFHKAADLFASKQGFDVRKYDPYAATKQEVINKIRNMQND